MGVPSILNLIGNTRLCLCCPWNLRTIVTRTTLTLKRPAMRWNRFWLPTSPRPSRSVVSTHAGYRDTFRHNFLLSRSRSVQGSRSVAPKSCARGDIRTRPGPHTRPSLPQPFISRICQIPCLWLQRCLSLQLLQIRTLLTWAKSRWKKIGPSGRRLAPMGACRVRNQFMGTCEKNHGGR